MDVSVVVPCFNEADNIELLANELLPVVEGLRSTRSVEVVFVDDGSADGTGDLLEGQFGDDPEIRIVRHDRNRGLGAALRTGFGASRGAVVVAVDSDASYPYPLIVSLLDRLDPDADIVTASCLHPGGAIENVPGYRAFLSQGASALYRLLVSRDIHTYTCMVRAYRREVIERVPFRSDGFLAVTELLVNAVRMGYRVRELPCTIRARQHGASKAKIARTILSHLSFQVMLLRHGGGSTSSPGSKRSPQNSQVGKQ